MTKPHAVRTERTVEHQKQSLGGRLDGVETRLDKVETILTEIHTLLLQAKAIIWFVTKCCAWIAGTAAFAAAVIVVVRFIIGR